MGFAREKGFRGRRETLLSHETTSVALFFRVTGWSPQVCLWPPPPARETPARPGRNLPRGRGSAVTEPVEFGLRVHLDVTFHAGLAGQANFIFMTDTEEAHSYAEAFLNARLREMLHAVFDVHAALTAVTEAVTVEVLRHTGIELDAMFHGNLAEVRSTLTLDFLLFADEFYGRHGDLFFDGRTPVRRAGNLAALEIRAPEIRWPEIRWPAIDSPEGPVS